MHALEQRALAAFSNQLRLLRSIDKHEIEHPEIDEWWPSFRDDPYKRFMSLDDSRQAAIWKAMLKRGALRHGSPSPALYNDELRHLLDLFMVSDPWPLTDDRSHKVIEDLLDRESTARGHESWPVAYHEHKTNEQADRERDR